MNKNPLEEMKKEYESIEIPTEMKSRLENTIRQAKEENKKVRFFKKNSKKDRVWCSCSSISNYYFDKL